MPEIYDERKEPNAYRRAGLEARPMRNAARWDEVIDTAFVDQVIDGFGARPEALVGIFGAIQERYGYLPERALRRISDRMGSTGRRSSARPARRIPAPAGRGPRRDGLRLRRLPLRRW